MLTLTKKRAFELYHFATAKCKNKPKYVYNSKKSLLVIFSLIFSSTLSGMIIDPASRGSRLHDTWVDRPAAL